MTARLVVLGLLASIAVLPSVAHAGRCSAAVRVDGDDPLSREVALDLVIRGVASSAAEACPLVRIHVERAPDAILVVITDPYGTSTRSVGAVTTASALVASWAEDLVASVPLEPPSAQPPRVEPEPIRAPTRSTMGGLSLLFELASDSNQLLWTGMALAGCAQVGPVCVGGLGRIGTSKYHGDYPPTFEPILSHGTGLDVLASISVPLHAGQFLVAPELDVGFGYVRHEWFYDTAVPMDTSVVGAVRFGARVTVTRSIGGGFALEAALAADALPARYLRYDAPLPTRGFDLAPAVRLGLGIRH